LTGLTENAKKVSVAAVELSAEARRASGQTGAEEVLSKAGRTASEISLAIHHINASSDSVSGVLEAIEQIAFASNMLAVNSALEASQTEGAGEPIGGIAEDLRKLAERCRKAVRETQSELQQSRIELEKGGQDVLELVRSSQPNEAVVTLERQAENLIRLAEGLDQTAAGLSEYLESDANAKLPR
jgi:methyl-accepting chemotaxis protein